MKQTKYIFKNTILNILNKQGTDEILSEAALPAYAHKNFLIDYIFWKRVSIVSKFIKEKSTANSSILDFGCGTGVLSYELASKNHSVTAIDLNLKPVEILKNHIEYPDAIHFIEGDLFTVDFTLKYDFIVALDVLEHISIGELPKFIEKFKTLLKPNGYIIISGPTENILYKIGRKIAGRDFTGHYHKTNISMIRQVFMQHLNVKTLARLVFPFILFEIFTAKNSKK